MPHTCAVDRERDSLTFYTVPLAVQDLRYWTPNRAHAGAGVTVNETITFTGVSTACAEVLTADGDVESPCEAVSLNSGGTDRPSLYLAESGD